METLFHHQAGSHKDEVNPFMFTDSGKLPRFFGLLLVRIQKGP
jgi:hypothetical protein